LIAVVGVSGVFSTHDRSLKGIVRMRRSALVSELGQVPDFGAVIRSVIPRR
ncbi:MAG: hypothetical protein HQL53_14705, partial [Magnetococcales bacterium]|nr:hypothetical protein [Magnetococcales bacterium]